MADETTQTTDASPNVTAPSQAQSQAQPATPDTSVAQPANGSKPSTSTSQIPGSLTEDDFRKRESQIAQQYASRTAQIQAEFARFKQQAEAQQNALERQRVEQMSDDQQANYWRGKWEQEQQAKAQADAAQQAYQYFNTAAANMLAEAGIAYNDPDIAPFLSGGASLEGITQLATGIAKVSAARLAQAKAEAEKAFKRGGIDALNEAGVTSTTSNTGSGGAVTAQDAKTKAYEELRKKLIEKARAGKAVRPSEYADLLKAQQAAGMRG